MNFSSYSYITSTLTVLIILTSAFIVIAQYFNNRQDKKLEENKQRVKGSDFSFFDSSEPAQTIKRKWDNICNEQSLNTHRQIILFMCLYLIYLVILLCFLVSLIWDIGIDWCAKSLVILTFALLCVASYMMWRLHRMRKQLERIDDMTDDFIRLYDAYKAGSQNSIKNPSR